MQLFSCARPVERTILPKEILVSAWLERINRPRCNASHRSPAIAKATVSACTEKPTSTATQPDMCIYTHIYISFFFAKRRATALPNYFRFLWTTDVTNWYDKRGCYKVRD